MHYIKQDDFDEFNCIAGKCPKSCCVGWQIVIDEEALENYKVQAGAIGEKLRHGIDFKEGMYRQNNRRCAMLNKENLCDLQCALGEQALCYTCHTYPRHEEEFEDVRELSLSLSCPEVARMAVTKGKAVGFTEYETEEADDFEDFDYLMYTKLVDAREEIYKIIDNDKLSLELTFKYLLEFAMDLQERVDQDRLFEMDDIINTAQSRLQNGQEPKIDLNIYKMAYLWDLERLDDEWTDILELVSQAEGNYTYEDSINSLTENEIFATKTILKLLIYTYFCGSVYDDWIYSKMALAVYSCIWIVDIYKKLEACGVQAKWVFDDKKDLSLMAEVTYRYAREVEHSDLNLDALEEFFNSTQN